VVAGRIDQYKEATTKAEKSDSISSVVDYVNEHGGFVKLDGSSTSEDAWVYAEPLLCREKVSQTFRDNLAGAYRSSNVAKRNKRRQEQREEQQFHAFSQASSSPWMGVEDLITIPSRPTKRMRSVTPPMPPLGRSASGSVSVCSNSSDGSTDWFDWDMPLRELEATAVPTAATSDSRVIDSSLLLLEEVDAMLQQSSNIIRDNSNHNYDGVSLDEILAAMERSDGSDMLFRKPKTSSEFQQFHSRPAQDHPIQQRRVYALSA